MLAPRRHTHILDTVRRQGSVRVRELAELLDVSEMTIRRDLDVLAGRSLLDKVHGGATRIGDRSTNEPGFEVKQRQQQEEKEAIAAAAVSMIQPGSAIGLTAGTTTWTLAKLLHGIPDLTVVTNAPSVAQILYGVSRPDLTVVSTGGIRTPSDALVGPVATRALSTLHLDQLFIGVHGMEVDLGYSTPNMAEAEVNRAFVQAARQMIVLADHSKWTVRGLAQIAPLGRADVVISDQDLSRDAIKAFDDLRTDLRLVGVNS